MSCKDWPNDIELGSTASNYFSPTLANICHRLKLRYDIAGVTLLAFGNGAPDVFSSISSFSGQSGTDSTREAMLVGIGALLGGSVFVTTVVVGSIAIICPCDVSPRYFIRDVCFHMIAASSLAVVSYLENAINTVPSSTGGRMIPLEIMTEEKDNSLNENLLQDQLIGNNNEFITVNKESNSALYWQQKVLRKRIHRLLFDSEWWDLPFYNQLWVLIESPLTLCRDLTIPTNDKGYWNKYYAMVQPFNCVIFLCFIFGLTVLAWGNSIGDYVANTAVARRGMGEMAIAGCYGSPIFDIFVGL
eukprot:gene16813-22297_t